MTEQITKLANGMTVATGPMPGIDSVALGVWVDVGSRHESIDEHGLSHLLEHMAFKGTKRRDARAIAEEIEAVGGSLNAYTGREQTAYQARVLKEDTALAVDILADILQNSTFVPQELERERSVILQEIGQTEDTPDDIVFDHLQETAYPGQPIGRSILGTPDSVRGFTREAVFGYLDRHYQAPSMTVVAAGAADHDDLISRIEGVLGDVGQSHNGTMAPARYAGGDFREGRDLEQAHLTLGLEGVSFDDADYYASQVFANVLGGGMSSRLFQEVREKRGLCYSIFAFAGSTVDTGMVGVYAGTGEEDAGEIIPIIAGELEVLAENAGEDEVARARAQLKAGLLMSRESAMNRCESVARQLSVYGRTLTVAELTDAIDKVDAATVRAFATRVLDAGDPVFAGLGPIAKVEKYDKIRSRFTG